jgi:hypothetical protein
VVPSAATATPLVDGTAAVGVATKYAREDHVHPAPPFSAVTSKPTTVAGYGITDALTASSFPTWTPFTPTCGGFTGGAASASGRFFKIGKLCFVSINVSITATLTGPSLTVTLPAPVASILALPCKETTINGVGGTAFAASSSSVVLLKDDATQFSTAGMQIVIGGSYETT